MMHVTVNTICIYYTTYTKLIYSIYVYRYYAGAVILAFRELHQPGLRVAYRDLKPENIVRTLIL